MYRATFHEDWLENFKKLDRPVSERVAKKIEKVLENPKKRHLGGPAKYFVDEVGQYRLVYRVFDDTSSVRFYFIGTHKEYEKWFKQFF
ncbi:MAG: type II toxin-antitoxin system RelE/ParE family toxin [Candidatus Micrarchaeota archaeon]